MTPPRIQPLNHERVPRTVAISFAAIAGVLMLASLARFLLESGLTWRCPSMLLFHLPCPSCGTTRALAALAQLHFVEAFRLNPLMVLALTTALAWGLTPPFRKALRPMLDAPRGWVFLSATVFLNWVYLLLFLPR